MKTKIITLSVLALMLIGFGCKSSSNGGDEDVDPIVGTWVSQGSGNVALGLAAFFKTAKIDAEFNENGTYNVVSIDSSGSAVTFTGNWQAGEPNTAGIRTIVLTQQTPTSLTSSGIFQIEGTNMTYEVIQTEPALDGVSAPTPTGGFGSTVSGGQQTGILWIQKFARVN